VKTFFNMRDRPEQRPRELLWLKKVWKNMGFVDNNHQFSLCDARQIDLASLPYADLKELLESKQISPCFNIKLGTEESELHIFQRFHRRDNGRIEEAKSFISRAPPGDHLAARDFTLVSDVYNGLGVGDELRELCFYLADALQYKHNISTEATALVQSRC